MPTLQKNIIYSFLPAAATFQHCNSTGLKRNTPAGETPEMRTTATANGSSAGEDLQKYSPDKLADNIIKRLKDA